MEKKKERVLAYNLSKEIMPEQLSSVTGGAALNMTSSTTYKATGYIGNIEAFVDLRLDG